MTSHYYTTHMIASISKDIKKLLYYMMWWYKSSVIIRAEWVAFKWKFIFYLVISTFRKWVVVQVPSIWRKSKVEKLQNKLEIILLNYCKEWSPTLNKKIGKISPDSSIFWERLNTLRIKVLLMASKGSYDENNLGTKYPYWTLESKHISSI